MSILRENDTIGLISCSNGLNLNNKSKIDSLINLLHSLNLNVITSASIYKDKNNYTHNEEFRANELMNFYKNNNIKAIFDLSGGDLCNEILDYLNYDIISKSNIPFIGYSDLTVILNSLYAKTNLINYNYQIRNLIGEDSDNQINYFKEVFLSDSDMLKKINYKFIKGNYMEGTLIGGNIRCFLKLAGTKYMPTFEHKILFLEALSGDINKISSFIAQYKQIQDLSKLSGVILGNFTEFENTYGYYELENLILNKFKDYDFPIIKTSELGHNSNSKAIPLGKKIILR